jgi:hypothetical protein
MLSGNDAVTANRGVSKSSSLPGGRKEEDPLLHLRVKKQISCFYFQLVRKMDSMRTRREGIAIKIVRSDERERTGIPLFPFALSVVL